VLETDFGEENNSDADPVTNVTRAAISRLDELGVMTTASSRSPTSRVGSKPPPYT
jgi:hypothetical protein